VGLYRHVTAGGFPEEYQEKENKTLRTRTIPGTSRIPLENQNNTRNVKDTSGEPEPYHENQRCIRITRIKP